MQFWNPSGEPTLALVGAGVNGYPNNGTAYLGISAYAHLEFSLTPLALFNFVSFDAANLDSYPPATLEVIGYKPQIMAPPITVTNYFTTSFNFQTFRLDSQFQDVYRVDVLTDKWSLDNVVISGVPEPSAGALALLGAACGFRLRCRRRRNCA